MKYLLPCLALFCLITSTTAAADCKSTLLTSFGFKPLANPEVVSGAKYCKSLQDKQSCCDAATINTFQTKADELINKLTGYASSRDKEMVAARDVALPQLKQSFQALKDSFAGMSAALDQMSNTGGNGAIGVMIMTAMIKGITDASDAIYAQMDTIKSKYGSYQKSRSACIVELVKLQASAWCLACDPGYATKGVTGTTVAMSDNTCNSLQTACYSYIDQSSTQNALLYLKSMGASLEQVTASLTAVTTGGNSASVFSPSDAMSSSDSTKLATTLPSQTPQGCTGDGKCPWICTTLFNNGKISEVNAAMGGATYSEGAGAQSVRLLVEEGNRRVLQSGKWEPANDEAGVTVTFQEDPGNTNAPQGAALVKASLMCIVGMVIALLF